MLRTMFGRGARWLMLAGTALVVVACGGGSNSCTDVFGGGCQAGGGTSDVANLSLNLSALTINNSGSETITATVTATNASNQTMEGAAVVISVDAGAQIAVGGSATDANGTITGTVRIGDNRNNRIVTVTAVANNGTLSVAKTFQVVGANLTATAVPAVLTPSSAGAIQYRLVDSNGNPMIANPIVVTGPGGVQSTGTTGTNGEFNYTYTAPATTGDLVVLGSAGGANSSVTVLVQAASGGGIPPVCGAVSASCPTATPVRSASVSANPSVVPVNTATTNNQSQIRVLFLSDLNAPVKNMRVRFDLAGDTNSIGGTFTTGNNIVYSDANGVATTAYVPGSRSSPTDGVTIRACWDYVDFTTCDPAKSVSTRLTVVSDPVSVTIGTNALIETDSSGLRYVKRYVVQVVDSSGVAKPDVQISPSIDLQRYIKGQYVSGLTGWTKAAPITICDNEDLNRNNTSETYADGWVEDANGSFNLSPGRPALEPHKGDVAISFEGSNRTDASGSVVLKITYPQNIGSWVQFNILVAASGISGTEGRANFQGTLPVPAAALTDPVVPPPFVVSPYGVAASPVVPYTTPDGTTHLVCTNPN